MYMRKMKMQKCKIGKQQRSCAGQNNTGTNKTATGAHLFKWWSDLWFIQDCERTIKQKHKYWIKSDKRIIFPKNLTSFLSIVKRYKNESFIENIEYIVQSKCSNFIIKLI